jgi:shikimate kinase
VGLSKAPPLHFRKGMKSWILVGMMGSGKSSVGRAIAEQTGRRFLDTDRMLVHKIGRPVSQLFNLYGETSFRHLEHKILAELEPELAIVSTGGGVVLREDNWAELRRLGPIVYLKASPETLIERLKVSRNKRPLLQAEDWENRLKSILAEREPIYEKADAVVPVDGEEMQRVATACVSTFQTLEGK